MSQPVDWRGTPINIGDLVIYGSPVGRSIALVEGTVDSFTKSGRVNINVIRRAYGSWGTDDPRKVHVGANRLTIVSSLPPSTMPTEEEKAQERRQKRADFYREKIASLKAGDPHASKWETVQYYEEQLAELTPFIK